MYLELVMKKKKKKSQQLQSGKLLFQPLPAAIWSVMDDSSAWCRVESKCLYVLYAVSHKFPYC